MAVRVGVRAMFNFAKLETWQKAINFADLAKSDFDRLYAAAEEQGEMLSRLRRSVLESA